MKFKLNWGNSILLFFIGFVSLAFYFIAFSLRHHNDLVVKDYYEKGANYTDQMNTDARSLQFIDSIQMIQESDYMEFRVAPSILNATPKIVVYCYRAMDERDDITQEFSPKDRIAIDKSLFARGRYDITVSWELDGEAYQVKKQISIKK